MSKFGSVDRHEQDPKNRSRERREVPKDLTKGRRQRVRTPSSPRPTSCFASSGDRRPGKSCCFWKGGALLTWTLKGRGCHQIQRLRLSGERPPHVPPPPSLPPPPPTNVSSEATANSKIHSGWIVAPSSQLARRMIPVQPSLSQPHGGTLTGLSADSHATSREEGAARSVPVFL